MNAKHSETLNQWKLVSGELENGFGSGLQWGVHWELGARLEMNSSILNVMHFRTTTDIVQLTVTFTLRRLIGHIHIFNILLEFVVRLILLAIKLQ